MPYDSVPGSTDPDALDGGVYSPIPGDPAILIDALLTADVAAAAASATASAASAAAALASQTASNASAIAAAASAAAALVSENAASASASTASTSATSAAGSASAAATSAGAASTSATAASGSATTASNASTAAQAAQTATEAVYDAFDDRYLGQKAANPTLDNDGNALLTGALFFHTGTNEMRVYSGTVWVTAFVPNSTYVLRAGDTMTSGLSITSTDNHLAVLPTAETDISLLTLRNAAGTRRLELLYAGTGSAGFYGITPGAVGINASAGPLVISTADVARISIAAAGNVTIAAPSSGTALVATAQSAGSYTIEARALTGVDGALSLFAGQSGGNNTRAQFSHDNSTGRTTLDFTGSVLATARFQVGGVDFMAVTQARNVTIAAPSSGYGLSVAGTSGSASIAATGQLGGVQLDATGTVALATWRILSQTGNTTKLFRITDFGTGNDVDRFTISAAGNVTIAAPSSGNTLNLAPVAGGGNFLIANDGIAVMQFATLVAAGGLLGMNSAHNLDIVTSGATRVSIAAAGNVTIATPSSGVALTVNSAVAVQSALEIYNTSATGFGTYLQGGSPGRPCLRVVDFAGTSRFTVAGEGNVTIATPSSGNALTVVTTVANAAGIVVDHNDETLGVVMLGLNRAAAGATQFSVRHQSADVWLGNERTTGALQLVTNSTIRVDISSVGDTVTWLQATPPTLANNSNMVFNLTSNTNLRVSVRGTDGVTRVANLTLA